ncbi:MAG: TlyA family RNA methyltransferase [Oscillospiraceae bacterium]|jgi:23S rRNA (cytidine1920-2'-O)/16S rRNA (cytidine1409-2'-O)-methyltransferase|nr:TlyA family RNA methyltransferase [Oscillospiraceae bacterium]
MASKQRLDVELVRRGLAQSREKAQALILSGVVLVDGQRADKASIAVSEASAVEVRGAPHPFVSRGGLKLEKAIAAFQVDATGIIAMDVGASTGGFTDVLLRAGAQRVYAIDVGYGQLDWKLRNDPRVTVMERTNARALTPDQFPEAPTLAVMDVSFISIRLILPALVNILGDKGRIITLVKPQFEAGRALVGKKGVVRDSAVHLSVLETLRLFIEGIGWRAVGADFSPVRGPEGNIEFLLDLRPANHPAESLPPDALQRIVEEAHRTYNP